MDLIFQKGKHSQKGKHDENGAFKKTKRVMSGVFNVLFSVWKDIS